MTDTGPVPGEGLPGNAGAEAVGRPHADRPVDAVAEPQAGGGPGWGVGPYQAPAAPAYTFLDQPEGADALGVGEAVEEDDDLLLMPGPQGSWSDPQPVPARPGPPQSAAPAHEPTGAAPGPSVPASGLAPAGAGGTDAQPATAPKPAAAALTAAPKTAKVPEPAEPALVTRQQAPAAEATETSGADTTAAPAPGTPAPGGAASDSPAPGATSAGPAGAAAEPPHTPATAPTPAPAAETGAHEAGGRDSGSIDLGEVRVPQAAEPAAATPVAASAGGQGTPVRRPLNMGPPAPEPSTGVSVRSLADRGPTPTPAPSAPSAPMPVRQPGPPTTGPEYLDVPADGDTSIPAQQTAEAPTAPGAWNSEPAEAHAAARPASPPEAAAQAAAPAAGDAKPQAVAAPAEPDGEAVAAQQPAVVTGLAIPAQSRPVPASGAYPAQQDEPGGLADLDRDPVAQQEQREQATADARPAEASAPDSAAAPAPPTTATGPGPQDEAAQEAAEPDTRSGQAPPVPPASDTPGPAPAPVTADDPQPSAAVTQPAPEPRPEPSAEQGAAEEKAEERPAVPAHAEAPETPGDDAEPTAPPSQATAVPEAELPGPEEAKPQPLAAAVGSADASSSSLGYDPAVRDAVHRVIRERRDIRNGFRQDPIPHEVLIRVLEAAHTAPSVGHSQPWDFVVIRSAKTRQKMHELAMRQREAYAKSLPKARAKQFRELKIEAILDTPVNIVVTADPTRGGRHTLGRYTQPQMAPYSSALAVENLWLAARAEGLGVGWVSFFDEREMVRELGLPEHLEVVAYLCVGYVDEFPEEPELMQAGWSKRRPLAWVVHEEEYGRRALPGEEPHDLLDETLRGIRPLDAKALGEAWERQKRMTKPSGALGMLEIISAQLSGLSRQCPPPVPEPAAVAIFAGDHGVHAQGVTAWPQEVTAQMVANFLGGGAVCNAFANQVGAEVCVVDVGVAAELPTTPGLLPRKVRHGTGDFTTGPAMAREDVLRAVEVGIETARDLVAAGNKALLTGEMGIANTTASAALISVYTGADPAEVTGRGTGINDEMHARKVDVVRRALELHRPDPADPIGVLAAIGGLEHAAMVGLVLGGASLRTPVILDGVSAGAAALVARAVAPEALAACIAGHRSAEPGHVAALTKLGLRPLVDLDLRLGEGTGALLALPLVQSAARVMHEVATFDSAGVTEKG